ncbi:tyrosine-type recombinase/integrase [Candidatus Woesearchaeota archaeon]|nr:tyrosine-type recombinase/integrase [Candidatus Woesearchaeota archaeon]
MDLSYLVRQEMQRRGYSERTIKTYLFCLKKFLLFMKEKEDLKTITRYDVKRYLLWLADHEKAKSTLNVHLQAVKFALEEILNKRMIFVKLPYAKVPQRLPEVLSKDEVVRLFSVIENEKHKLMIKLLYSAGLRVSELVHLRVRDLDFENKMGWVRQGKYRKDRLFILAEKLVDDLKKHIDGKEKHDFVFEGRKGLSVHVRTVQEILKNASKKAKLGKNVHPHTLRHSFATHLIEEGNALQIVQVLMGHKDADTTMVYVHLVKPSMLKVKSPLDSFDSEKEE